MKYLIYLVFFFIIFTLLFFWYVSKKNLQKKFFKNVLLNCLDSKRSSNVPLCLFSNAIVDLICEFILTKPEKVKKQILKELAEKNYTTLIKKSSREDVALSKLIKSLLTDEKILNTDIKHKSFPSLSECIFYESTYDYEALKSVIKKIPNFYFSPKKHAFKSLFTARCLLLKTDLKKASQTLMKSMKTFRKHSCLDELAYSYFLLGEIYRISKAHDVAQMMFEISSGIYKKTNHFYGQNFIASAKAVNCIGQKRFDEARSLFQDLLKKYKEKKDDLHEAEILNQLALLANIQNNHADAIKYAKKALSIHEKLKNIIGASFSQEQIAIANYAKGSFKIAEEMALAAQKGYLKNKNETAYAEILALLIRIYIQTDQKEKLKKANNALKKLEKQNKSYFSLENLRNLRHDIDVEFKKK